MAYANNCRGENVEPAAQRKLYLKLCFMPFVCSIKGSIKNKKGLFYKRPMDLFLFPSPELPGSGSMGISQLKL
jgi:hypothetical protein